MIVQVVESSWHFLTLTRDSEMEAPGPGPPAP
jgi:hypothetical protein